jgi:hypothetical protein
MPFVRDIVRRSAEDNYRFSTLITNIVLSDDFLKASVPEQKEKPAPVIQQAAVQK